MRNYQSNAAAIYYHPANAESLCVGLITQLKDNYVVKVLEPSHIKILFGIPRATKIITGSVIPVTHIPKVLLERQTELDGDLEFIYLGTELGRSVDTTLEKLGVVQQLLGRNKLRTYSLTPAVATLHNKNQMTIDFFVGLQYSKVGGFHALRAETKLNLRKEKTLHIHENIIGGKESFMLVDSIGNFVGYLPPHMDDFCRTQYKGRRLPILRIKTILGRETAPNTPAFSVLEVAGDFLIQTIADAGYSNVRPRRSRQQDVTADKGEVISLSDELADAAVSEKRVTAVRLSSTRKVVPSALAEVSETKRKLMNQVALTALTCMNHERVIGKDNRLPWHIPEDLEFFKKITKNEVVIVGRKTFESLPKKMPHRHFIVVSGRAENEIVPRGDCTIVVNTTEAALQMAREKAVLMGRRNVYVIGGANVYEQLLPRCRNVIVTRCQNPVEDADAFFPVLPENYVEQTQPIVLCKNEFGDVRVHHYQNLSFLR